jgi:hypothetical protein
MATRHLWVLLLAPLATLLAVDRAHADDRVPDGSLARGMINAEAQAAIDQGLEYLAQNQSQDGSWGTGGFKGNVAITSLGGLAFLAGGHQPGRGKYGKVVSKAITFVLHQEDQQTPGFFNSNNRFGGGPMHGPMYNHGFATLFLAEVYGMGATRQMNADLKKAIEGAVRVIIRSQNPEGGWRYQPQPNDADISVTICQIMALRAARNAGFAVPKETADKCIKYVKACQDLRLSGGFSYQAGNRAPGQFGATPGFARTAAGVVALYSAGLYEGEEVKKGLDFLMRYKPGKGGGGDPDSRVHFYYGHYYAAQAMWIAGGRYWREWFPAIRDELIKRPGGHRLREGNWHDNAFCTHYCTAMALIILQVPNNYLPIFQR